MIYMKVAKTVNSKHSYHKEKFIFIFHLYEMMGINQLVVIISRYM